MTQEHFAYCYSDMLVLQSAPVYLRRMRSQNNFNDLQENQRMKIRDCKNLPLGTEEI